MMMMKHQQKRRCCRRVFSALGRCLLLLSLAILLERGNVMVMVVSALLTTAFAPRSPRMLVLRPSASYPCFARPGSPLATRGAIALHGNHGDSHRNAPSRIFRINPTTTTTIGTKRRTFTALSMSSTSSSSSSTSSTAAASSSQPPPPALSLENISCSHNGGETWQLKDVSYVLPRGAKVALVGRNGAGKSTLLKILAEHACRRNAAAASGAATARDLGFQYTGQVTIPRNVRVAYVEQEPYTSSHVTVADALLGIRSAAADGKNADTDKNSSGGDVYSAVHAYRRAADRAESDPQAFAAACAEMDAHSGSWNVWTKMEEVATKLRIRHLQDQPLSKLSGGERKRVSLAAALVLEPDVLLLDEPSNWLSLAGVQWLTDLLLKYDKKLTILMVTHDRIFLDQVCNRILELDQGSLYEYVDCDYAGYLQAKEERLALLDAAAQSARAKYRVELSWMRRQPQARQTKAKARIDAFYKLQKATKPRPQDPNLNLLNDDDENNSGQRRLGGKIISMRNVNLQFGDRVMLKDFSYDFCKGDRICISGANGVGKTTFLRLLTGEQPADSGEIEIGETIVLGIYDQMGLQLKADQDAQQTTVLAFVTEAVLQSFHVESLAMTDAPVEARRLLNKFEFPRSRWNERISVLSGGEKRRLQMLSVLCRRPNVLIMDEPSVDCDLDTIMALETYLDEFAGVLLIVSHDRAFASKVTDHLFLFEGDGEIKDFRGSLSEYASALVEIENQSIPGSSPSSSTPPSYIDANDEKIAAAEKKEQINKVRQAKKDMDKLDRAVEKLRVKAKTVQKALDSSNDEGWTELAELTATLTALNDEIEEKEMQWMELAEVVEQAEMDTV